MVYMVPVILVSTVSSCSPIPEPSCYDNLLRCPDNTVLTCTNRNNQEPICSAVPGDLALPTEIDIECEDGVSWHICQDGVLSKCNYLQNCNYRNIDQN